MDQSQNQDKKRVPGTFTTMKDALEPQHSSPEDRLHQAGNFLSENAERSSEPANVSEFDSTKKNPQVTGDVDKSSLSEKKSKLSGLSIDSDQPTQSKDPESKELDFSRLDDNDFKMSSSNLGSTIESSSQKRSLDDTSSFSDTISLDLEDESKDFSFEKSQAPTPKKSKTPFVVGGVLVILIIVGVSVYILEDQLNILGTGTEQEEVEDLDLSEEDQDDDDISFEFEDDIGDTFGPTDPGEDDESFIPGSGTPLVISEAEVTVALNGEGNIRTEILTELSEQGSRLIEVTLAGSDNLPLTFEQYQNLLGIQTPARVMNSVQDYWVYAYNQDGIYKLATILQLDSSEDTQEITESWLDTIPQDLSSFSLSSSSRNAPIDASMNSSEVLTRNNRTLRNYFYNYTEPTNSIDVTYINDYIIIASSQATMDHLGSLFDL